MYKQLKKYNFETKEFDSLADAVLRVTDNATIPFAFDNTDYQTFKIAVLEQQLNSVEEHSDSFSIGSDISILKDADGNNMTIEQGKTYVRTLP